MRTFATALVVFTLALVPAAASAITVDQVVGMAKAGVTDAIILAFIERDATIFSLEPEQIVGLRREGLSEAVIIAMLKSGRAEGEEAARADSAYRHATMAASLAPAPEVIIVGHGPERPNTAHGESFWTRPRALSPAWSAPYSVPYDGPFAPAYENLYEPNARLYPTSRFSPPALCYAQVRSGSAPTANALTYVTECPAVMQPRRKSSR